MLYLHCISDGDCNAYRGDDMAPTNNFIKPKRDDT